MTLNLKVEVEEKVMKKTAAEAAVVSDYWGKIIEGSVKPESLSAMVSEEQYNVSHT